VEGGTGVGAYLAQWLLNDGETVIDVPAKLSTRARIFAIGHGRMNDPADDRTVAVVALRTRGLPEVGVEDEMVALRLLSDRRTELVARRTATVNRLTHPPPRPASWTRTNARVKSDSASTT